MPTFTPPTVADIPRFLPDSTPVQVLLMRHYSNTVRGRSVVKISGTYQTVDIPTTDQLTAAGTEGVDWFLGGRTYTVTTAVGNALTAAGYTVT